MADNSNVGSYLGQQFQNPFSKREEYVTITGVDSAKQQYSGKTKSGQTISFSAKAPPLIDYGGSSTAGVKSVSSGTIPQNLDYVGNKTSLAPGVLSADTGSIPKPTTPAITPDSEVAKQLQLQESKYNQGQAILAGAKFIFDVMAANTAYGAAKGQAAMNIMQAKNQAADAINRGRQAQLSAQSEGYQAGQNALLAMAAQGQDVQGAAVQKIQGSYEAMGVFNGMREEINSMREALGYELEEINYNYQVDQAKVARDTAVIGSAINAVAGAAPLFL